MNPPTSEPAAVAPTNVGGTRLSRGMRLGWSILAGLGILAIGYTLIAKPQGTRPTEVPPAGPSGDSDTSAPARVIGPHRITITPGTPLASKLTTVEVIEQSMTTPLLTVSGSVVACHDKGTKDKPRDNWVFQTPEIAAMHADWIKALAEIEYAEKQLVTIQELAEARVSYLNTVVERQKKLVAAGTDSRKDLAAAEADRIQAKLQAQKDIYEAENNVQNAKRNRASLERQLFQNGIDPKLLATAPVSTDIISADIPETKLTLAGIGQKCSAYFYAFPGETFSGRVISLSPALSKERRSLRVFFLLDDPGDRLKPGMFADIGLGTDPHHCLLIPADAILHLGRSEYVFVADQPAHTWRVQEITLGEAHGSRHAVLTGLKPGDKIIGRGAILLKPLLIEAIVQ